MNDADRRKLLHGPYHPPALRRGDRVVYLARDCDVIITSWTDARISWPRCRALGTYGGGRGILVDEVLARAIRCESAAAIRYWWGVNVSTVAWWRRVLAVDQDIGTVAAGLCQRVGAHGANHAKACDEFPVCPAHSCKAIPGWQYSPSG